MSEASSRRKERALRLAGQIAIQAMERELENGDISLSADVQAFFAKMGGQPNYLLFHALAFSSPSPETRTPFDTRNRDISRFVAEVAQRHGIAHARRTKQK